MAQSKRGSEDFPATHVPFRKERLLETEIIEGLATRLFNNVYGINEQGVNVTTLDLPGTPEMIDGDIMSFLVRVLHVGDVESLGDPKSIEKINAALALGRRYLIEQQQFDEKMVPNPTIKNVVDIVALFRKTRMFGKDEKRSSRREMDIVMHCALLTAAFAAYEIEREGMQNMRERTEYVDRVMLKPKSGEEAPLFMPLFQKAEEYEDAKPGREVSVLGLPGVKGKLHSRAKRRLRAIGKMLRDPVASAEEALKDPIGFRLELPREQVAAAMVQIVPYLFKNLSAHEIEIEDRNMFPKGDPTFLDVESHIRKLVPAGSIKEIVQKPGQNQFRVFKVSAKIAVPKTPDTLNPILVPQKIEFQIVDIGNKNEAGLLNHNVYELSQTIAERTRLMGGIGSAQLRKMAEQVAAKGGPDADNVIKGLEDQGIIFRLPVTGKKYASVDVWRRWIKAGTLIPEKIAKLVEGRLPPEKQKAPVLPEDDGY